MSYEGLEEYIGECGHYWTEDAMAHYGDFGDDIVAICPYCKSPAVWENSVDQTNGCDNFKDHSHPGSCCCGMVDMKPQKRAEYHTCSECGKQHTDELDTYKPPKTHGRMLRENVEWQTLKL